MTDHPINPPDELLDQWCITGKSGNLHNALTLAYRAGADQELEASLEWLVQEAYIDAPYRLRAARRPKPPRLKEQALEAIGRLCASVIHDDLKNDAATIRRALEALDD